MTAQAGTVYWYVRTDADHDISADQLQLSLDEVDWSTTGTFIAVDDWPPSVAAKDATCPAAAGLTGYWWRLLTGPANLALNRGYNRLYGRITDNPETPHFSWILDVAADA